MKGLKLLDLTPKTKNGYKVNRKKRDLRHYRKTPGPIHPNTEMEE